MGGDGGMKQVHLLGLPVETRSRFIEHLQELTRELSLVRIGAEHPPDAVSRRLLRVAAELDGRYAAFRAEPEAALQAALAAGTRYCDVTYTVPAGAGAFLRRLGDVLDDADDLCRSRTQLLSLPASEDVVAYRRWFVAEADRQLAGQAPRPWRTPSQQPLPERPAVQRIELPAVPAGAATGGTGEALRPPLVMDSLAGNVSAARRYVRQVLRELDAGDVEEAAELGVSELVTNAVLHARTAFSLSVRRSAQGRIRIEVGDSSGTSLQFRPFATTSTTGRGLGLVASLSHAWGVDRGIEHDPSAGPGKTVWFEPRPLAAEAFSFEQDWAADLEALT